MPAPLVDEGRTVARDAVELAAVRLAALGQLVGPVAHPLLPLAGPERLPVLLQALEQVIDAPRARKVGGEPGQPVVDDMRVGVVEARKDR